MRSLERKTFQEKFVLNTELCLKDPNVSYHTIKDI